MAIETELKLRIQPAHLAKLQRHALLKTGQLGATVTRRLHNIYFDTPALDLHHAQMALRLRRSGGKWIQTLKGGGAIQAGLHQRNEWECVVPTAQLNFANLESPAWDAHLPVSLRTQLQPVFVTHFLRTTRLLAWRDAQIEVCMDRGEVRAGALSRDICELELELKVGAPQRLFELALAILEVVPFEIEVVNKAELGFHLLTEQQAHPTHSPRPIRQRKAGLADLLQAQVWSGLLHLQRNLRGIAQRDEAEYLHQVRVALRRLRVVLHWVQKINADETLLALQAQLAEIGRSLGKVREWEVFVTTTLRPLEARMPQHQGLQNLLTMSEQHCDTAYNLLQSDTFTRAMQRVMLNLAIWMNGDYWATFAHRAPPRKAFAHAELDKLAHRLRRFSKHARLLSTAQLHDLRKLMKRLHDSLDFFIKASRSADYLEILSGVQAVLGEINDVAVAHRLLAELARQQGQDEAIMFAQSWIARDVEQRYSQLHKGLRKLRKQPVPW